MCILHNHQWASLMKLRNLFESPRDANATSIISKKSDSERKEINTAEDAAGVGTVTSQNSTNDVNKSTPNKNLRAFNLIKETNRNIRKLKSRIKESTKKLDAAAINSIPGARKWTKLDNSNPYHMWRFGIALAGSPKSTMAHMGPVGQSLVTVAFTDADQEILDATGKAMGFTSEKLTPHGSDESQNTNVYSPVAKIKKNRYGI